MIYGKSNAEDGSFLSDEGSSFAPEAESTCEELLKFALQADPGNSEALQSLASVRLSQQRPDEAKQCLEQAWSAWKDLDLGMYPAYMGSGLTVVPQRTQRCPLSQLDYLSSNYSWNYRCMPPPS
jgi:hypothetical protein